MNLLRINSTNKKEIKKFLNGAGKSLETFRYFDKRDVDIISNHLVTYLLYNDEQHPVAYGHLDKEKNIVWLGISVIETAKGKGYGKKIMTALIDFAIAEDLKTIKLSVDKSNFKAIQLYMSFGFKISEVTEKTIFFIKNI